jgi:diadenosine tetraphosphate (Ap4A) HIT family hydrolase
MSADLFAAADQYVPRTEASAAERAEWAQRRAAIGERVAALTGQGICYQCRELAEGDVLGPQYLIGDEEDIRVVLASDPRVPGHTIVVWKPHAHDFTELDDQATTRLFTVCRDVARALRGALAGVDRVYQVTMCDGPVNHLHVQLVPRYAGTPIGSRRLLDARGPVLDGDDLAAAVRALYAGLRAFSAVRMRPRRGRRSLLDQLA